MDTAKILPFPKRPLPGVKPGPKRPQRVSVRELHSLSLALDEVARAARKVVEHRGCTGCPEVENLAIDYAMTAQETAERLSLAAINAADADIVERERA